MTAPESSPVEQVDRDAVQAFHREMAARLMAEIKGGDPIVNGHDADAIHQAFARHRLRARTEADQRVREALVAARKWVEANTAQVRCLSTQAAAPGEAMLKQIDSALTGSNPGADGGEG